MTIFQISLQFDLITIFCSFAYITVVYKLCFITVWGPVSAAFSSTWPAAAAPCPGQARPTAAPWRRWSAPTSSRACVSGSRGPGWWPVSFPAALGFSALHEGSKRPLAPLWTCGGSWTWSGPACYLPLDLFSCPSCGRRSRYELAAASVWSRFLPPPLLAVRCLPDALTAPPSLQPVRTPRPEPAFLAEAAPRP